QMVYYTGVDLPHRAVANNPYAQSLSYLSNFVGFGGTTPIPGPSPLSLSRFVRAAYRLQTYDGSDGIGYAFDTLDYVKSGTKWSIVYEVQNLRIHFRTLSNPQIRQIDLSFFDFSCDTPVKMLDIESNLSGDVSSEFIDYSDQTNCDLVTLMSTRWAQMYHREPDMEQIDAMCQYPEESTLCLGATTGPVPESAVFALLGVGVMGVGGFLLFRQRRQLKRLNS
ncbi:MAG: PEP-CTERM sorting domain-containing protein, partial [Chloroflexi bacterium]|nr:PEP-CTERM sorting domain-containing protein [Chloroflexota bacterium]